MNTNIHGREEIVMNETANGQGNNPETRSRTIADNIRLQLEELRTMGLSNEEILSAIGLSDGSIRMRLTHKGLVSEDGIICIRLSPLERSVYKLFMQHPEGISLCDMWQHYDELIGYYSKESIEGHDRIVDTIDNLCDSRERAITQISRIKRKICEKLGPVTSASLIVKRSKGGNYRINGSFSPGKV